MVHKFIITITHPKWGPKLEKGLGNGVRVTGDLGLPGLKLGAFQGRHRIKFNPTIRMMVYDTTRYALDDDRLMYTQLLVIRKVKGGPLLTNVTQEFGLKLNINLIAMGRITFGRFDECISE
jgi:hypothetical protein